MRVQKPLSHLDVAHQLYLGKLQKAQRQSHIVHLNKCDLKNKYSLIMFKFSFSFTTRSLHIFRHIYGRGIANSVFLHATFWYYLELLRRSSANSISKFLTEIKFCFAFIINLYHHNQQYNILFHPLSILLQAAA